jgi:hypothetical protein
LSLYCYDLGMKPKKRQKLCYNCEGEVDLDVIVCPFCAADLREEKKDQLRSSFSAAAHSVKQLNGQESLYPPSFHKPQEEEVPEDVQVMPSEESPIEIKNVAIAIVLFAFGVQLAFLGIFILLFQSNGTLILKWDARLWFLYLFAAVPLLVFGYRSLKKV